MSRLRVHLVVHEAFEAPGAIADWAAARGHSVATSRVHLGEPLPPDADAIDLLVVMGGPQSPTTTLAECPHFDAAAEMALIRSAAAAGRAVLGVCLGAQLIGAALGAPAEPSPEREIGAFPITLTDTGRADPIVAPLGPGLTVGHWHADMPGLTAAAGVLATSVGCPRQIVAYGGLVYAFQCHLELSAELVERLIDATPGLDAGADARFVEPPAALRAHDWRAMNAALFGVLDRLEAAYRAGAATPSLASRNRSIVP